MRQILMSCLLILTSLTSAFASDRYPAAKRYVNQTGEVVATRQMPLSYTVVSHQVVSYRHVLPAIQIVPVVVVVEPVRVRHTVRYAPAYHTSGQGLLGAVNQDPQYWPSGRTCCRPGEPYFNENPNS